MKIDVFQIDEFVIATNINCLDYRPINERARHADFLFDD